MLKLCCHVRHALCWPAQRAVLYDMFSKMPVNLIERKPSSRRAGSILVNEAMGYSTMYHHSIYCRTGMVPIGPPQCKHMTMSLDMKVGITNALCVTVQSTRMLVCGLNQVVVPDPTGHGAEPIGICIADHRDLPDSHLVHGRMRGWSLGSDRAPPYTRVCHP